MCCCSIPETPPKTIRVSSLVQLSLWFDPYLGNFYVLGPFENVHILVIINVPANGVKNIFICKVLSMSGLKYW